MFEKERLDHTLLFCTAFVHRVDDPYYSWNVRYRIWLEAVRHSGVKFDQILLVDDGSGQLPDWPGLTILQEGDDLECNAPIVLYHFKNRLGRRAVSDFPGWVRSFFFVSQYAEVNGFSRVVHLEADAFLISPQASEFINRQNDGWIALWSNRHQRPESGIQVIAGSGLKTYAEWAEKGTESFVGAVIETTLPFSRVHHELRGDRYGEEKINVVPADAEWCMQGRPSKLTSYEDYFWWMPWFASTFPKLVANEPRVIPSPSTTLQHEGLYYLQYLQEAEEILTPKMYFEIGTHTGTSLKMIRCDAVCVDPAFAIASDVLLRRRNTHFHQDTSDNFFADSALVKRLLPSGFDLAFLDGLHLFEALLRDFVNTEKLATPNSMIILHDCLPLNERMAERIRRNGDELEPEQIRDFWTGDVWKVVLIIRKYRPDLCISYLDCGPTGLVVCTALAPESRILDDKFEQIVAEFSGQVLSAAGLRELWELFPTYDSRQIVTNTILFERALYRSRQ
jgi:hypothetical protein